MPACNLASLGALAQQLQAAAVQQDWLRIAQLDKLLVSWLQDASTPLATDSQELGLAWQSVRDAHMHALYACQQAKTQAAEQLQQLQQSQEAQQAYAWQEVLK